MAIDRANAIPPVPPLLDTLLPRPSDGAPWTSAAHLLGGLATQSDHATCLYFDGVPIEAALDETLDLAMRWFSAFGSKPKVLLVAGDREVIAARYSIDTLRAAAKDDRIVRSIRSIQFFPKGRTTVNDTWRPSIYFARALGNPTSAFFCVNALLSEPETRAMLLEGDRVLRSDAAYGFLFHAWFSPLGYYWGIAVEPSCRGVGRWEKQKSKRLSHWRDNANIGIPQPEGRRVHHVGDGHVRDVYPLMLLGRRHLSRVADSGVLADLDPDTAPETARLEGEKTLWRVPESEIMGVQQRLDAARITLSGDRFVE